MPKHTRALELLSAAAVPVAAPSANRFGHVSPTTAAHVRAEFGPDLMVLDGGPCPVGIESTILDLSRGVLPVSEAPGLGVDMDPAKLERYRLDSASIG
jgi:L-threonylcarbamoyladenylate synthase